MRSLLYADSCFVLRRMKQYLLVALVIALVPVLLGVSRGSDPLDIPAAFQMMVGIVALYVMLFFTLSGCFQADEMGGWERARLTLPVTRRDVVLGRYLFILLSLCSFDLVITLLGVASARLLPQAFPLMRDAFDLGGMLLAGAGSIAAFLALVSLQMPFLFMWGARRASFALSLPALIPLASMVIPKDAVALVARAAIVWVESWGPWPVLLACVLAALVMYGLSALLSCVLYERREL